MARTSADTHPPLPFHPDDSSFNRMNALYLAHASDVAYLRVPAAAARDRLGLRTMAFCDRVTRTRGFLGVCDTHAVLAFRGTDPVTVPSWLTDFVVKLVECGEYEGRVHHGFSSALRRAWIKVEAVLEAARGKPLFLTGHSLGGALAVLAASRLAKVGPPPTAIYTFGAPRVGDASFCAGYALPTYRVVNRLDLVPEMPLASLKRLLPDKLRIANAMIRDKLRRLADQTPSYSHVNTLVYIDLDGAISVDARVQPWPAHAVARAIATRGKSFLEGITDHLITNYIRGLEGQGNQQSGAPRRIRRS